MGKEGGAKPLEQQVWGFSTCEEENWSLATPFWSKLWANALEISQRSIGPRNDIVSWLATSLVAVPEVICLWQWKPWSCLSPESSKVLF